MSDYDGDHLRHVKRGKKHNNPAESSNLRFGGFDDFHFPSQGTPGFQQNGSENGRQFHLNANQNQNYATNPSHNSQILSGVLRNLYQA